MTACAHPIHHHAIRIIPEDIDFMGHVNNAVYLKWVQDAVISYWQTVAPAEAVAKHLWVALKHEITYRAPAFLDDAVLADVVATGVQGSRAFFTTMIQRGDTILAEVRSSWCCIDVATRRPARIARDLAARFLPDWPA
ncbi:acyl-CoA thioesterase [Sandaracinobacter sp.]|uniref:acyl-CoA thioesterase n=1 Tax=Sandaracinobacter sp. TaxID=2487581 RepID=UPI0035B412F4